VLRPAMIDKSIHGRPYAPASVDDIVHQYHAFADNVVGNIVGTDRRRRLEVGEIIAVGTNVQRTDRNVNSLDPFSQPREARGTPLVYRPTKTSPSQP
jgi:hypothetical protein